MSRADHHGPFGKKILIPNGPDPCGRSGARVLLSRLRPAWGGPGPTTASNGWCWCDS